VISSSGLVTSVVGITATVGTFSGAITATTGTFSGAVTGTIASTSVYGGLVVDVTSTGAVAAGSVLANGVAVTPSSKANMNSAFAYLNSTGGTEGSTLYLLGCHGSKSPDYLLGVGATAVGVGAATDNGFVDAGLFLTAAIATTTPMVGLKVQFGDSVFYVMCIAQCGLSA
jgi:hypothetical protein